MPSQYLQVVWELWKSEIIDPSQVIKALNFYDYQLSYIGNSGLKAFKENETFEFKLGER